ncbi:MAG: F-type H+-transporting ATPase subunit gamma [Roseivirga sp.]|jgi:F-type H+-transporting ATPase subunit gamma
MANLKELRNRITSVGSTMQITSAMKMVSAAKLKRAQDAITQLRPYAQKIEEILVNVSATLDSTEGVYSRQTEDVKKVLIVAISSNRGLCGAFNANVVKRVMAYKKGSSAQVDIFSLGKKSAEILTKKGAGKPVGEHNAIYEDLSFPNASAVAELLMGKFVSGEYDRIEIVYNQFVNAANQAVQCEEFLPIRVSKMEGYQPAAEYIYEPAKEEILEDLIPKSLKTQVFKALLDSQASEHGARMTAMHKATDNANEMRKELSLEYNKARQAAITNEILEIVGGANALEKA